MGGKLGSKSPVHPLVDWIAVTVTTESVAAGFIAAVTGITAVAICG